MNHAGQDFPIRSRRTKSIIINEKRPIPSAVANPVSHEPLRRTGSFAAATITAVLAIWATTSSNVLQSLFLSLSYAIHQTLRSSRWSTVHRKQLYQRSLAHPALHAPSPPPSPPPSRAPLPPSRRPRTHQPRHPPASATTTPTISGKITQRARTSRSCRKPSRQTWPIIPSDHNSSKRRRARDTNSSSEARRRRRQHQNGPRRRRRRRRECRLRRPSAEDRRRRDAARRRTPSITAVVVPPFPLPRRRRHRRRRLSRWSWQPQRSRSLIYHPRASPCKFASWSAAVARTAGNLLFSTAPLEDRGFRGR